MVIFGMCLGKWDKHADTRSRGIEEVPMDQQLKDWHPSKDEVAAIVAELRPLIRELADQERQLRSGDLRRAVVRRNAA